MVHGCEECGYLPRVTLTVPGELDRDVSLDGYPDGRRVYGSREAARKAAEACALAEMEALHVLVAERDAFWVPGSTFYKCPGCWDG